MQNCDKKPAEVSRHLPPVQRDALVRAAAMRDMAAIDRITKELARMGLVRPPKDCTRLDEWKRIRGLAV